MAEKWCGQSVGGPRTVPVRSAPPTLNPRESANSESLYPRGDWFHVIVGLQSNALPAVIRVEFGPIRV
jgi:hypothetical protein